MIHNSDGMSKKCNSKSLFFFIFCPGFAPYFRMSIQRPKIVLLDIFKNRFGRHFQSTNLTGILLR